MLTLAMLLGLAQAPQSVTLLEGGWVAADVDEKQITVWNDVLFSELGARGVGVRRKSDIAQVLGIERQKQLLGCAPNESSCMAEIAAALDADGIISGSVGRSGASVVVNVRVVSATGQPIAQKTVIAPSVEAVLPELSPIASSLVDELRRAFPGRIAVAARTPGGARRFWWIPASLAVVSAGVGIGLQVSAQGIASGVREGSGYDSLAQVQSATSSGKAQETASYIAFGIAGAAAVGTVLLVVLGRDAVDGPAPPVTLAPTTNGFVVSGRWP